MAEWLSGMMSGWPMWAIALAMIVIVAVGTVVYFYDAQIGFVSKIASPRRKNRGKK